MFRTTERPLAKGKRILVPTDLSERSLTAIHYAISLARKRGAEVVALHVVADDPQLMSAMIPLDSEMLALRPWFPVGERARNFIDNRLRNRDRMLQNFLSQHFGPEGLQPVKITRLIMAGEIVEEILHVARRKKCDLIVMATRGRGWIARKIFGSVSEKVARQALRPVIIIYPSGVLRQKGGRAATGPLILREAPNHA